MGQCIGTLRRWTTFAPSSGPSSCIAISWTPIRARTSPSTGGTPSGNSGLIMQSTGAIPLRSNSAFTSRSPSGLSVTRGSSAGATTSSTSTTGLSRHSTLGDGDINYNKGLKAVDEICRQVMTMSFEAHFKGGRQPIKDWLAQEGWSNSALKKRGFLKEQLDVINAGKDFADMDITLKYSLLRHCCNFAKQPQDWRDDPNSEEYSLYALKRKRNEFSHSRQELIAKLRDPIEFDAMLHELKDLSFRALDKLKDYRLGLGQSVADIDQCRLDVKARLDALKDQSIIVELGPAQTKLRGGKAEVENKLKWLLDIEPFPHIFRLGSFKLQDIYEGLDLHTERRGLHPKDTQKILLPVENLLTTPLVESNDIPLVICIEGSSGVGKSTLLAHVVSDRLDTAETITGLKAVDLVLHLKCKQVHQKTLLDLIKFFLPETTKDIGDDLLLRAVRNLSLLVLVDGFDEVREDGRILLKHLFQEASSTQLRVIMTTRTGSLGEAESLMGSLKHLRVTLPTMSKTKIKSMVRKYYRALRTRMIDPSPEDQVVSDVCTAAEFLAPTPRNVLLLTYLAIVEPEKVKAPLTLPELLDTFDEISLKMLQGRLREKGLSLSEIENDIRTFTLALNAAALECLLKRKADITMGSLKEIANKCKHPTDMMDTFLSSRWERTVTGDQALYVFPHQSQLEYRAALGVCDRLKMGATPGQRSRDTDLRCILRLVRNAQRRLTAKLHRLFKVGVVGHILGLKTREEEERKEQLGHHWNFLLSLVGALWLHKLLSHHAEEMAELVVSSCRREPDEALEAIGQARMDQSFTKSVVSRLDSVWVVTKHFHILENIQELPKRVIIVLWSCCNEVPHLAEALDNLRRRKGVEVKLNLHGCMSPPCCFQGCCTWPIRKLTAPGVLCSMKRLRGLWDPGALIPTSVEYLELAIHSPKGLEGLQRQMNVLPHLPTLDLRVCAAAGYEPRGPPLKAWINSLILYDVKSVNWRWTINFLTSLHACRWYGTIRLMDTDLTPADIKCLRKKWAQAGVRMERLNMLSIYSWQMWEKDYADLIGLFQTLKVKFSLGVAPTRAEQTETTAGQDPPANQKLQFFTGSAGPLPRVLDGAPEKADLPKYLQVPYTLRLKLRATVRDSTCTVWYWAPRGYLLFLVQIGFESDCISLQSSNPSSGADVPKIRIRSLGLEAGRVHRLEIEEREDRFQVDLDGKALGGCPKVGHSENVTLCDNIEIKGYNGLELISTEMCSRSCDQGHPPPELKKPCPQTVTVHRDPRIHATTM